MIMGIVHTGFFLFILAAVHIPVIGARVLIRICRGRGRQSSDNGLLCSGRVVGCAPCAGAGIWIRPLRIRNSISGSGHGRTNRLVSPFEIQRVDKYKLCYVLYLMSTSMHCGVKQTVSTQWRHEMWGE